MGHNRDTQKSTVGALFWGIFEAQNFCLSHKKCTLNQSRYSKRSSMVAKQFYASQNIFIERQGNEKPPVLEGQIRPE